MLVYQEQTALLYVIILPRMSEMLFLMSYVRNDFVMYNKLWLT